MRTPVHNVERGQASPSEASFLDVASKSSGYVIIIIIVCVRFSILSRQRILWFSGNV